MLLGAPFLNGCELVRLPPDPSATSGPAAPVATGPPCVDFARDPADARFDDRALRAWCDADGDGLAIVGYKLAMFTRYPCGAGHAAILTFGQPLGAPIDGLNRHDYVQDPRNEFLGENWIAEQYQGHATLPADAAYTGWTNGNIDLWISRLKSILPSTSSAGRLSSGGLAPCRGGV